MHTSRTNKPKIFITMGDPAGIGPEIIVKSLASPEINGLANFIIVGDAPLFEKLISASGLEEPFEVMDPGGDISDTSFGAPTISGAKKAIDSLSLAVKLMRENKSGSTQALVTAPLSKEKSAEVLPGFIGHTEFLQEAYGSDLVTMAFVGNTLKAIPVTRHIPLKDEASNLNEDVILGTLKQVIDARKMISGKEDPVIGVCGLNPHSGEGGRIGDEEARIIVPAIENAKRVYKNIVGPIPSDVIFYKALKKDIDIVVAMYHDQCLTAFKMVDFDNGVNMTLGLDDVRTSPDHGTAFDIAGKGVASPESITHAIRLAIDAVTS